MTAPPEASRPRPLTADPQGRWAAFAEAPNALVVARLPKQAAGTSLRWRTAVPEAIASLSASRDGRWLAVGHQTGGSLALWAAVDDAFSAWVEVSRTAWPGASGAVELAFSPTDDTLAVATGDKLRVLRLDLEELNRLRHLAEEPAVDTSGAKRVFISSRGEYARYAALLETALEQDLKVERRLEGAKTASTASAVGAFIEHADVIVVLVGAAGRRQSAAEILRAKDRGTPVILVQVSSDIKDAGEWGELAVANVDIRGEVLPLSDLRGTALTRAVNVAALSILRSVGVDTTLMLHELQHTYEDAESRYFNPPVEIQKLGRGLINGNFRGLVSQLRPDELLIGLHRNQATALVATHVASRVRLHALSSASLTLIGFYAVPRDAAIRGWGGTRPVLVMAAERPMVVVSYVRAYAALARSLVSALEETGRLDVRYDGSLSSREGFPSTVLQWIDQSDALVVLAGPASAQANYSKRELERAQKLSKPVVSVIVEEGGLPSTLASYQAVNVDDDGTTLLLARLKGMRLESALRRAAFQVVDAVTGISGSAGTSSGTSTGSSQDLPPTPPKLLGPDGAAVRRSLRRGDRSDDLIELQRMLAVEPTGVFDAVTESAVRQFQLRQGQAPDGIVGPRTWQALGLPNKLPSLKDLRLTPRQAEVLELVVKGLSIKMIAHQLKLSEATVKTHVAAVERALGVSSRKEVASAVNRMDAEVAVSPEPPRPVSMRQGSRAVIAIGVDRVEGLPALRAASVAARSFVEWATGNQRIPPDQVTLITDGYGPVRVRTIQDAVDRCLAIKDLDQLIVFFSGHGAMSNQQDVWLLSDARANANETINVNRAANMARSTPVPHIVFISDAARDRGLAGMDRDLIGSAIFPSFKDPRTRCEVDRLFSTGVNGKSYEVIAAGSSLQPESVFTSVLLAALSGRETSVILEHQGHRVATSRSIRRFVSQGMSQRLEQLSIGMHQDPDFQIESSPDRWLASF